MSTPTLTEDQLTETVVPSTEAAAFNHGSPGDLVNTQKFDWSNVIENHCWR